MRGMALGNAGGRTRERDPNPEGKRRADTARYEAFLCILYSIHRFKMHQKCMIPMYTCAVSFIKNN